MVVLLDIERMPLDVSENMKDRDAAHRKINLNQSFYEIALAHSVSTNWVRTRFDRFRRKVEWAIRKGTIDPEKFVHPALIEMHLLFRSRPYEFYDTTKGGTFFDAEPEEWILKRTCAWLGISTKQWYYMTGIMYATAGHLERRRDETGPKTQPLAVWDRFTAMQQEWTPEAQYREFNEMTGDIE